MPDQNNQLTPDQTAASLAFATNLMQQGLPQDTQTQNTAPQPPSNQETPEDATSQMQGLESRIMDEIGTLREEIKKVAGADSGKDIEDLKKQIEQVLAQDD